MFIAVGAVAAIVISLSIFKKLFKAVLYIILLVVAVAVYTLYTSEDPNKASKTENKKTTSMAEKIDDAVPKDVKRSLNTVSKTVNKVLKEQKKAVMKLEKELKKHRKELGN